jgi:hypothetical protein
MKKLTYKQAYDKIIQAYFRDDIKPLDSKFCFCGTLCDNSIMWNYARDNHPVYNLYSFEEYKRMELPLLTVWYSETGTKKYEDEIFEAMCAALNELKQIHKDRGENVDEVPEFTKRQLQPQN